MGHTSAVDWWTLGILIYEMIVRTVTPLCLRLFSLVLLFDLAGSWHCAMFRFYSLVTPSFLFFSYLSATIPNLFSTELVKFDCKVTSLFLLLCLFGHTAYVLGSESQPNAESGGGSSAPALCSLCPPFPFIPLYFLFMIRAVSCVLCGWLHDRTLHFSSKPL